MGGRSVEEQMRELETIARAAAPPGAEQVAMLRKALGGKTNILAARAARVAEQLRVRALIPDLAASFKRFIDGGNDKGCDAMVAIVKALGALEAGEVEDVYLAGARHVQMEPRWGGSYDAAVELRCESVAALTVINSRHIWDPLVRLLADADGQARATAARCLGAMGGDERATVLLRYKLLIGDAEPTVMGEAFGSILRLTRSTELVEPALHGRDHALREPAMLALGESRLPEASAALLKHAAAARARVMDGEERRVLFTALAMTRQPDAIDHLIGQVVQGDRVADEALAALAMYRHDAAVRARVESAARAAGPATLRQFEQRFA